MKVLVTGGAGFVGSMVCRKLVEGGHELAVVDNLSNGHRELVEELGSDVKLHEVDIRDDSALKGVIADVKPEAICHLAAIHFIPYCNEHPLETMQVNTLGTLNLFEACREHPPRMIVIASTAAVYGISDVPHQETDVPEPMDIYGISKHVCEQLAQRYVAQTGTACISARIFNAVGTNETNPHLVPALVEQLRAGQTRVSLGNLEPKRDYIDTRDLASALIHLLQLESKGHDVFNIGTGREHSVREVVSYCEKILGREIEIEQKNHLVRKVERMHLLAATQKIQSATGWAPQVKLEQTLEELLQEPA